MYIRGQEMRDQEAIKKRDLSRQALTETVQQSMNGLRRFLTSRPRIPDNMKQRIWKDQVFPATFPLFLLILP